MSTTTTTPTLGVGITTDVGAVANGVTAVSGLIKQEDLEMNSPEMIKAAEDADKQAKIDQFNRDLQSGDTDAIRREIAGK
jgi:hypothetical protein